jgi:hypothetical protein
MSLDIVNVPGTVTHIEQPVNAEGTAGVNHHDLIRRGYEWISFQLVNGRDLNPIDIHKYGSPYPSCGAWGVTYDAVDFYDFGRRLGAVAVRQGADHVICDLEECAKYTRDKRGMKPVIEGLRASRWMGPVHLSTYGAPVNPKTAKNPNGNDFGMDIQSFLETGGGVHAQAYVNNYDHYAPEICRDYWTYVGCPADRLCMTIEVSKAEAGTQNEWAMSGAAWLPYLEAAGVFRNFNIFMTQFCFKADWDALEQFSRPRTPPPPDEEVIMEQIGSQHGITAFIDWLQQQPGVPTEHQPNYDPAKPGTWPWPERLERTLSILRKDHDESGT